MGNAVSPEQLKTSDQKMSAMVASPHYISVKKRAEKMGIQITFQGDGSLNLQNPKDLVKGNLNIPGPETKEEVATIIRKMSETLEQWAQTCGYVHVGYQ